MMFEKRNGADRRARNFRVARVAGLEKEMSLRLEM